MRITKQDRHRQRIDEKRAEFGREIFERGIRDPDHQRGEKWPSNAAEPAHGDDDQEVDEIVERVARRNGQQICAKASIKIAFDQYDATLRLEGLKKLSFNSMMGDDSQLRERLAYELYRRMNVISPQAGHAFLTLNGDPLGLFGVVEDLDDHFAQQHWPSAATGNLYKEAWPIELDPTSYTPLLQTNEKNMPDNSLMAMFASALFAAKTPAQLPAVIEQFAHTDQLLRYMAVDRAISNYDGITTFYCDQTGKDCTNHNYFWYQHPAEKRFILGPWDLTQTFLVQTVFDKLPPWNQIPSDCGKRTVAEDAVLLAPGCDLVFQGLIGAGSPAYDKALDQLLGVWDVGALDQLVDGWAAEINDATELDPNGPGAVAWRAAVENLKAIIAALRERLEATRAKRTVAAFGLTVPGTTDFEAATALGFALGASSEVNPRSGGVFGLQQAGALGGAQDVRFAFELTNDLSPDPALDVPFANARLPLGAGMVDLTGLQQIQLLGTADQLRTVRIEIDSPKYGNVGSVDTDLGRYGWEVLVGPAANTVMVSAADLALPPGTPAKATLAEVLANASGLVISPQPRGRNDAGLLPSGKSDVGFVRLDDITIQ